MATESLEFARPGTSDRRAHIGSGRRESPERNGTLPLRGGVTQALWAVALAGLTERRGSCVGCVPALAKPHLDSYWAPRDLLPCTSDGRRPEHGVQEFSGRPCGRQLSALSAWRTT